MGSNRLDGVETHVEVATQPFDGIHDGVELAEHRQELLDVLGGTALHGHDEHVVLRPVVAVEAARSRREADRTLDVADRRTVEPALHKQLQRRVEDALTCVGAASRLCLRHAVFGTVPAGQPIRCLATSRLRVGS